MKKIISLFLLITLIFGLSSIVNAVNTNNITLSSTSQTAKVGDEVTISLLISQKVESADFLLKYPIDMLELISTSISKTYIGEQDNGIQICYAEDGGTNKFDFTFKVLKNGNITISTDIEALHTSINDKLEFENQSLTIISQEPQTPSNVDVTSIALDKTNLNLKVEDVATLIATVAPTNATNKTVTWSSNNTAVASVTNGKVTALKEGTAIITAKAGDKTATCTVTVSAKNPNPQTGTSKENEIKWVDFSKMKYTIENVNNKNQDFIIKFSNITTISGHTYYLAFAEEKFESIPDNYLDYVGNASTIAGEDGFDKNGYKIPNDIYAKDANLYVYILETAYDESNSLKYNLSTITITKQEKDAVLKKEETGENQKTDTNKENNNKTEEKEETKKEEVKKEEKKQTNNVDKTTSNNPMPQTGETFTVIVSIVIVAGISIFSIIKYRKYRDIN